MDAVQTAFAADAPRLPYCDPIRFVSALADGSGDEEAAPWHIAVHAQETGKRHDDPRTGYVGPIVSYTSYCGQQLEASAWAWDMSHGLICRDCLFALGLENPGLPQERYRDLILEQNRARLAELEKTKSGQG